MSDAYENRLALIGALLAVGCMCLISSHVLQAEKAAVWQEGKFVVADKYIRTVDKGRRSYFTIVLENDQDERYVVHVTEADYANLDEQESIRARFRMPTTLSLDEACDRFSILTDVGDG